MTAQIHDRLLTVRDLCELLSISESTVRRLVNSGAVPFLKVRGSIRFQVVDVQKYLDEQTVRGPRIENICQ